MHKLFQVSKGIFLIVLLQSLTACSYFQYYADRYTPHAGQSAYMRQMDWLRKNDVQVVRTGDQLRMVLPTDKFFEPASAEFLGTKDCVLAEIAKVLRACGRVSVEVTGHTDDIGGFQRKLRMSELQAQAVASYLWQHGVRWHRMDVHGYANDHTVASDSTVKGSMHNRRVEIRIY